MHSPVSGIRQGATSVMQCIDVAALISACVLRRNTNATIIPFHTNVVLGWSVSPKDTVMTNARLLATLPQGGTNCSAPLAYLNKMKARGDLVIYVSDNQSWIDSRPGGHNTATMLEWERFKKRNPSARMACIDLQPYSTVQAPERNDILNIGGFSDQIFGLLADFAAGHMDDGHWVKMIGEVGLPGETDIAIGD
jgi:60 kDa SS-A/Ro ribonucleoprotein